MKQEIPRSARDVLGRQTAADEHPSADLLSGFMERALSADENARVTMHLARCADCREILFLASAATEPEQRVAAADQQGGLSARQRGWAWWKWVAPAVAAVIIVGVAIWHSPQAAKERSVANDTLALSFPSSDSASTPPIAAEKQKVSPTSTPPNLSSEAVPARLLDRKTREMAAKKTPGAQMASSMTENQVAMTAPPPAQAKPVASAPVPLPSGQMAGAAPISPRPPASSSQSVEVTTAAPLVSSSASRALAAAPKTTAKAAVAHPWSDAAAAPNSGNDLTYIAQAPVPPPRWRIADGGRLETEGDSGHWTYVLTEEPVKFDTVAVIGNEVWAGGSDGALFHSTDSGGHWTRVSLSANGQPASGAVHSIRFDTPAAGRVTTDAGETWNTSDGGKTWSKN
jgi:hypothetical protein